MSIENYQISLSLLALTLIFLFIGAYLFPKYSYIRFMKYRYLSNTRPEIPEGRSGHCAGVLANMMAVYGGFTNIHNKIFAELWFYHLYRRDWKRYYINVSIGNTCASSSLLVIKNMLYVFGGTGYPFGERVSNVLSMFDFKTKSWSVLSEQSIETDVNQPIPLYGSLMVNYGDYIYIYSGSYGPGYWGNMHKFDLTTRQWTKVIQVGNVPPPNHRPFGAVFGHTLYCFGGSSSIDHERFKRIYLFDFKSNTWVRRQANAASSYPPSRIFEAFAFSDTHAYMSGGLSETGTRFNDIWSLDFVTLTWRRLDMNLKEGLMFHTSVIFNDSCLVIFGGSNDLNARVNRVETFDVKFPTLLYKSLKIASHLYDDEELAIKLPLPLYNIVRDNRVR